jgi:hypothetical protein
MSLHGGEHGDDGGERQILHLVQAEIAAVGESVGGHLVDETQTPPDSDTQRCWRLDLPGTGQFEDEARTNTAIGSGGLTT